jgi:hypothetical protein
MARRLFPCLYPLESAKDATATVSNQLVNESMTSQNSFAFCVPTCCCHLTLNPKQQYLTDNEQSEYFVKCPNDFPIELAVELVCQACNESDNCLIRYLELRMQKQGGTSLMVLGEVKLVNLSHFLYSLIRIIFIFRRIAQFREATQ